MLVLPGLRVALGVVTAVAVVLPLAGQLWIYPAVGIKQPPADAVFALNYSDIAVAYDQAPSLFSSSDTRLLTSVAPLSTWKAGANCYSGDALTNTSAPFDRAAADRLNDKLLTLWTKVLKQRPDLVIGARICRGHIAWAPFSDPTQNGASTIIAPLDRSPDLWGWTAPAATADLSAGHLAPNGKMLGNPYLPALRSHPLSATLHKAAVWWQTAARTPQLDWLLWRGATWCYLAYAALACYALRRRRKAVYALGGILLGLQLTLIAANPAELFRYNVAPLFIGPFCLTLLAACRPARGPPRPTAPRRVRSASRSARSGALSREAVAVPGAPDLVDAETGEAEAGDREGGLEAAGLRVGGVEDRLVQAVRDRHVRVVGEGEFAGQRAGADRGLQGAALLGALLDPDEDHRGDRAKGPAALQQHPEGAVAARDGGQVGPYLGQPAGRDAGRRQQRHMGGYRAGERVAVRGPGVLDRRAEGLGHRDGHADGEGLGETLTIGGSSGVGHQCLAAGKKPIRSNTVARVSEATARAFSAPSASTRSSSAGSSR